jgi:hypothetical protein
MADERRFVQIMAMAYLRDDGLIGVAIHWSPEADGDAKTVRFAAPPARMRRFADAILERCARAEQLGWLQPADGA